MKKAVLGYSIKLLMIVLSLSFMAACSMNGLPSDNSKAVTDDEESSSGKKTIIRFARPVLGFSKEVSSTISIFNKTNTEGIEIEVVKIPNDRYDETLNMLFTSGQQPDVFEISDEWIRSYIKKEWIADITKYADTEFMDRFPSEIIASMDTMFSGGRYYSFPSCMATLRLIYNKDMFVRSGLKPDAPPKNLAQLKQYAKKISDNERVYGRYGFALQSGDRWKSYAHIMEGTSTYSGIHYYNPKERKYDLTVYKNWLQSVLDMKENGSLFPGEGALKSQTAVSQFAEGNIGMMYVSNLELSLINQQYKAKCDWGIAFPPALDEKSSGLGLQSILPSSYYGISSKTLHMDKAVKVWKLLYSEDYLGEMYIVEGLLPIKGLMKYAKYNSNLEKLSEFYPTEKEAFYQFSPSSIDDWTRIDIYADIISGKKKLDNALLEQSGLLNSALERYHSFQGN